MDLLVIIRHVPEAIDPMVSAHLTTADTPVPSIARYAASADLADLVTRYWVPVWSLAPGVVATQRVLQHPVCTVVVTGSYAVFTGVATGLSVVDLSGQGWAVGTMLRPAAGRLLWGAPVRDVTDRQVPLAQLESLDGAALTDGIREAMAAQPEEAANQTRAIRVVEEALRPLLPADADGLLVNGLVDLLECRDDIVQVGQLGDLVGLGERSLQRLTADRLGLSPKWLVQRRRLHAASERLKAGTAVLADVAADLGYADQAHFTRDFKRFTGMTPGAFLGAQ